MGDEGMKGPAPEQGNPRSEATENASSGDQVTADCGVIEVRIRELSQLFESLDPSPFHEKDLDRNAEKYINDSAKELPTKAHCALVLYIDQRAGDPDEGRVIGDAIRVHFARRAQVLRRSLRHLMRRGLISLVIGLAFLVAVFIIAQTVDQWMGESALATFWRESLLIVGWVAMWRPLEIFLYDWWPIVGERRVYDRLSRIRVRVVYRGSA
jgi:hypothetical protein